MSVLLKNLKMPKEGETVSITICGRGEWFYPLDYEQYGEAVDVPTPHGRLVDGDALDEKVEKHRDMLKVSRYDRDLILHYTDVAMAPTVIEAEE